MRLLGRMKVDGEKGEGGRNLDVNKMEKAFFGAGIRWLRLCVAARGESWVL